METQATGDSLAVAVRIGRFPILFYDASDIHLVQQNPRRPGFERPRA
jgi:hypothetical protein